MGKKHDKLLLELNKDLTLMKLLVPKFFGNQDCWSKYGWVVREFSSSRRQVFIRPNNLEVEKEVGLLLGGLKGEGEGEVKK